MQERGPMSERAMGLRLEWKRSLGLERLFVHNSEPGFPVTARIFAKLFSFFVRFGLDGLAHLSLDFLQPFASLPG